MVVPYKRFVDRTPFDAIVIGSGIGGLGAAALLAKAAGQRVLVLERHYAAGGFTHVFHMFDYLTEGRLDWQPSPMSTIASLSAICVSPTDGESRVCATN